MFKNGAHKGMQKFSDTQEMPCMFHWVIPSLSPEVNGTSYLTEHFSMVTDAAENIFQAKWFKKNMAGE